MKIEFLYPELCMYGDSFNIKYLSMCNSNIEVIETKVNDEPYFVNNDVDMIYLGSLSESSQIAVIRKLMPYKNRIVELINANKVFFVTGTGLEIFGKSINRNDELIECLDIFDFETKYDYRTRYHDLYLGKYDDLDIIGFKCQFSYLYNVKETKLFETIKGIGHNKQELSEGIRVNNFIGTNVLGPLLVYNPLLVKRVLKLLGLNEELKYEDDILEAYQNKLKEYKM